MPTMSNLLVRQDDATDMTLIPVEDRDEKIWRSTIPGRGLSGQFRLTAKQETGKNGLVRVNLKLDQPLMEIIPSGSVNAEGVQAAPKVAAVESASITFYLNGERGTDATRANLLRMMVHLLSGAASVAGNLVTPVGTATETYRLAGPQNVFVNAIATLTLPN